MVYSDITPNNIVEAVNIINILHGALHSRWAINFSLYGSVLRQGVGNDIDICVVHSYSNPSHIIKAVSGWLEGIGFEKFGLENDKGFLAKRLIRNQQQVVDVWFVFNDLKRIPDAPRETQL